ncbi:3972_t:CDS:2, partial [Dentiscutata heterogama]
MSSSITPFYRPGVFPALSSRLLTTASQSLRAAIQQQLILKKFLQYTFTRSSVPIANSNPWLKERMKVGKVDAGEDAFFYVGTNEGVALGVADGVGGWTQMGIDPATFSWALMDNAASIAKEFSSYKLPLFNAPNGSTDILDAKEILNGAFDKLIKSGKVKA